MKPARAVLVGVARAQLRQEWPDEARAPTSSASAQEPAMQIGEQQEEFEILPTEEDQEPLVPPEPEPQRQPEDTPA